MPEINPVTKEQLFEKKIAENTGSDYNVGDISDVIPVTKDQALLKEIALNSAEQSGDISELEEKVTANTKAIETLITYYEENGTTDSYGQLNVGVNLNRCVGIFVISPVGAIAVRATVNNVLQIWAVNNSSATADTLKQIRNEAVTVLLAMMQ